MENFENRTLFHGDNLPFLRAMNTGSVHLIATDPPFNKGRDFHATPDSLAAGAKFQDRWSWEDDVEGEWVDQITDDWPNVWTVIQAARESYGDDMGAFLCFMGVRLIAMRRVLRDDGSLYLHCDPTASHYLKQLLDAIFGRKHFLGEIQWNKQNGVKTKNRWGNENEIILCFAKKISRHTFNITDPACRKPFSDLSLSMHFKKRDESGRRFRDRTISGKTYRYYADEGRFIGNLWNDIPSMQANTPLKSESTGYPTQKPLKLYERIIKASSNEGDWVLDPFAGCATTCVAAERLGRKWVGIDLWDGTHGIILDRLQAEGLAGPGGDTDRLFTFGDLTYTDQPPERTVPGRGSCAVPSGHRTIRRAGRPQDEPRSHAGAPGRPARVSLPGLRPDVRRPTVPPARPQHPPRRRRHQPHHQPRPSLRPLQPAQEPPLHPVRAQETEPQTRVHGQSIGTGGSQ